MKLIYLFYLISSFLIYPLLILIVTFLLFYIDYTQLIESDINIYSQLFLSSLVPVKTKRLTKKEREGFFISENLRGIIIGLLLGDLSAQKQTIKGNAYFRFEQGIVHKDYLYHLYELFQTYCSNAPKITNRLPDSRTGTVYTRVSFFTYCLPCFTEFYNIFYIAGKKRIPTNIAELLTPLSIAYWICDDGGWGGNSTRLHTNSYTLEEVNMLTQALNDKFNLKCSIIKNGTGYYIRISSKSMPVLQNLMDPILPSMMRHKVFGKSASTISSNPDNGDLL